MRDEVGHKIVDFRGSDEAEGYYVSNGGMQKIHWKKDGSAAGTTDELAYLKFYDEEGNETELLGNSGRRMDGDGRGNGERR